jgi:hypothetical protein
MSKKWMYALVALVALLVLGASSRDALAFPHYQFSSETSSCSMCHFAPAGGGILNDWGRGESVDTLSWSENGEADALHGAVEMPDWLALGGDLRLAGLFKDTGKESDKKLLFFPMQVDLNARVEKGEWSFTGSVGLRGQARKTDNARGPQGDALSYIVSRRHYISYRPDDSKNVYRAGRFYAPYGLRLADHTSYIRRYLGFNILQETYGVGLSRLKGNKEYHVTAHVSDVLRHSEQADFGGTMMGEWRTDSRALGASARVTQGDSGFRALASAHYKKWLSGADILLMAELDGGYQRFDDSAGTDRFQMAAYAGPVWFPMRGMSVSLAYELYDEDVEVKHTERQAISTFVSFLPRTHYEVLLVGRGEKVGSDDNVVTGLLQLHYYL